MGLRVREVDFLVAFHLDLEIISIFSSRPGDILCNSDAENELMCTTKNSILT